MEDKHLSWTRNVITNNLYYYLLGIFLTKTHDLPLCLDQATLTFVRRFLVTSKLRFGVIASCLALGWTHQHWRTDIDSPSWSCCLGAQCSLLSPLLLFLWIMVHVLARFVVRVYLLHLGASTPFYKNTFKCILNVRKLRNKIIRVHIGKIYRQHKSLRKK